MRQTQVAKLSDRGTKAHLAKTYIRNKELLDAMSPETPERDVDEFFPE